MASELTKQGQYLNAYKYYTGQSPFPPQLSVQWTNISSTVSARGFQVSNNWSISVSQWTYIPPEDGNDILKDMIDKKTEKE